MAVLAIQKKIVTNSFYHLQNIVAEAKGIRANSAHERPRGYEHWNLWNNQPTTLREHTVSPQTEGINEIRKTVRCEILAPTFRFKWTDNIMYTNETY